MDQKVREQNLDADGLIRVQNQGFVTVGPAPQPFHFHAGPLTPSAPVFKNKVTKAGVQHLAITSITLSVAAADGDFVKLLLRDLAPGGGTTRLFQHYIKPGTSHFAFPHPIVLPLTPLKQWSVVVEDINATAAVWTTIVGYTFTTPA